MATREECSVAWQKFWKTRSTEALERLAEIYKHLINPYVQSAVARMPQSVGIDEIEAAALLGLYQAIIAHDDSKGTDFEVYAPWRIRGSIVDELRAVNPTLTCGSSFDPGDAPKIDNTIYQQLLKKLPTEVTEFLDLFYNKHLTAKDIANLKGSSEQYVKAIMNEILNTIRQTFYQDDKFNGNINANAPFDSIIGSIRKILGYNSASPISEVGLADSSHKLPFPPLLPPIKAGRLN